MAQGHERTENGIVCRTESGITVLTLDRPPVNALDLALLEALVARLERMQAEPPRALVLAGRKGCFSAGLDLKVIPSYDQEKQRRTVEALNEMVLALYGMPCPVIAALAGHAIAGGFVIALCADYRIASSEGRYGLTELKVGVPYPAGPMGVAAAELSAEAARVLVLGAATHSADACLGLGAIDEIQPAEAVLERALVVSEQMGGYPASLYKETKSALRRDTLDSIQAAASTDPLLRSWLDSEHVRPDVVLPRVRIPPP